jgi:hypothetical protein
MQANNYRLTRVGYLLKVLCVLTRTVVYSAHVMHQYWTLYVSPRCFYMSLMMLTMTEEYFSKRY